MEIYVSEKEKDFIDACLSETKCYEFVSEELQYEDSLRLISLEQHEAEVIKPLEEEIKRLEKEIKSLENKVRILYNAAQITDKNYMEQIPNFKKEERQKVIAELEEWVDEIINILLFGKNLIDYKDIKQKLNEMKGETK